MRVGRVRLKGPQIFYGWWVVLACAVISYYGEGTSYYGFGVFFNPIREEFAWSAAVTALAVSISRLGGAFTAPLVGFLVDRFGPRRPMLLGIVVMGLGFLAMSRISSLPTFYAAFVTTSLGFSFGMFLAPRVAVVNWFRRRRGTALGILLIGAGLAGTMAPGLAWLLSHYGWRSALVMVGLGAWVVGLPLATVVRHRPERYGMLPDGDAAPLLGEAAAQEGRGIPSEPEGVLWHQALATRTFWFLAAAIALSGAATTSVVLLLVPHLESVGVARQQAALAITFLTLSSLVGRLGMGWLGDRLDKRYVLAAALGLQATGVLILAFVRGFWMVFPFLLFFGPGFGGGISLRPAFLADHFGRRNFGAIQGLTQSVMTLGSTSGPFVAAWIFDVQGSYQQAWLLLSFVALVAVLFILLTGSPRSGVGVTSRDGQASP